MNTAPRTDTSLTREIIKPWGLTTPFSLHLHASISNLRSYARNMEYASDFNVKRWASEIGL
jgi:hypothetical protein